MPVEPAECFYNKSIDNQIYTILEKMVEVGISQNIPSADCFRDMTIDDQLYALYSSITDTEV